MIAQLHFTYLVALEKLPGTPSVVIIIYNGKTKEGYRATPAIAHRRGDDEGFLPVL